MSSPNRSSDMGRLPLARTNASPTATMYSARSSLVTLASGITGRLGLEIRISRSPCGPGRRWWWTPTPFPQPSRHPGGTGTLVRALKTTYAQNPLLVERRYRSASTGFRAIAVLVVMAFHLLPGAVVGGYLGVDIFFVISGFLITALLLRERATTGTIKFGAFWLRRVRRLVPASCCCSWCAALPLSRSVATFSCTWAARCSARSRSAATGLARRRRQLLRRERARTVPQPLVAGRGGAVLPDLAVRRAAHRVHPLARAAGGAPGRGRVRLLPSRWRLCTAPMSTRPSSTTAPAPMRSGSRSRPPSRMLARDWPLPALSWPRVPRVLLPVLGWVALAGLLVLAVGMVDDTAFPYRGGLPSSRSSPRS